MVLFFKHAVYAVALTNDLRYMIYPQCNVSSSLNSNALEIVGYMILIHDTYRQVSNIRRTLIGN